VVQRSHITPQKLESHCSNLKNEWFSVIVLELSTKKRLGVGEPKGRKKEGKVYNGNGGFWGDGWWLKVDGGSVSQD